MSTADTPAGPLPSGNIVQVPGLLRGGQVEKLGEGDSWTATVAVNPPLGNGRTIAGDAGVLGGQLVQAVTGDRIVETAEADSVVCVGLAMFDQAEGGQVTVASSGVWELTASESITAGQRVACAANGAVKVADNAFTDETPPVDLGTVNAATVIGIALSTQATPSGKVLVKLTL